MMWPWHHNPSPSATKTVGPDQAFAHPPAEEFIGYSGNRLLATYPFASFCECGQMAATHPVVAGHYRPRWAPSVFVVGNDH
jgi:hypothetical protein